MRTESTLIFMFTSLKNVSPVVKHLCYAALINAHIFLTMVVLVNYAASEESYLSLFDDRRVIVICLKL